MPGLAALARVGGLGATPAVPTLSYTAANQFTITDFDATLDYTLSNCSRVGAVLTVSSGTATVTAKYPRSLVASAARTMLTAAHARVLDGVYSGPHSESGCGPRGGWYCGGGSISSTAGDTWSGPGTLGDFCGGSCPGNCYGYFGFTCYNWHWTDYSGSGYTLIGSVWGKAS